MCFFLQSLIRTARVNHAPFLRLTKKTAKIQGPNRPEPEPTPPRRTHCSFSWTLPLPECNNASDQEKWQNSDFPVCFREIVEIRMDLNLMARQNFGLTGQGLFLYRYT
jgi:hypothetical protein